MPRPHNQISDAPASDHNPIETPSTTSLVGEPQASNPKSGSGPISVRDRLLEAKRLGFNDHTASEYAGLTSDEFHERQRNDPSLETQMRQARAQGFAEGVRAINAAPQWQGRRFLLTTLWGCEFAVAKDGSAAIDLPTVRGFRQVARKMTPDQMSRAVEVMETGRVEDSKQKAAPATPENVR